MAQRYFLASFAGLLTAIGIAQGLALLPHANADDVYALAFVSDVISGQDPIYWTVGSHNSFIPDKIIVALGYLLGFDGGANLVFFAAVYYFLLFVAIVFFVRSMNFDSANAALIGAFVIIFCGFYDPKHAALAQLFVTACIHNGVLPFALFIFGLVVRFVYVDDRQGLAWLALWLTTLIVFSDAIAIVQIVVPALAVLLIVVVMQRPQRKPAAAMALALIIGTAAGVALQSFLSEFKSIQQVPLTFQTSRMLEAAANYVRLKDEIAGALG